MKLSRGGWRDGKYLDGQLQFGKKLTYRYINPESVRH